jgi:hypothetical protein
MTLYNKNDSIKTEKVIGEKGNIDKISIMPYPE